MKNRYKLHVSSIIIIGLLLSLSISYLINNIEDKAIQNRFENIVDNKMKSFYRELLVNLETLYTLSILFNNNQTPSKEQFSQEAQKIIHRHKAIQALEWIPKVKNSQRKEYEKEFYFTKQLENKQMVRVENKDLYFPVYYVQPLKNNEEALGFDLSSNPNREKTIKDALKTKQPQITQAIELVQNKNKKGFLAFLPIFDNKDKIRGFVLGVFVIEDIFIKSILNDELSKNISFKIFDTSFETKQLIYTHKTTNKSYKHIIYEKNLPNIWSKQWSFSAMPSFEYISERKSLAFELSLIVGILLTIIVSYRINRFHNQKFESLQELKNKNEILYIQSRYATIGETLSNIEHQWRSPLSKLSSNIISIQSEIEFKGLPSKENLQIKLENMQKTLNYMSNLVDEFKNFHIQDKKKTNFLFDESLDIALKLLEHDFTKLKVKIIRPKNNNLKLYGYHNEFSQVLINILSNSRDVFIERRIKNPLIQIQSYIKDEKIFIKIRDNAKGIDKEHIDNIFEQFYTTKQSSGIGLHLSKMIICEHMQGKIQVKNSSFNIFSKNYVGAAFIIELPLSKESI
jgi:CHASE1-domain containing sensor protein